MNFSLKLTLKSFPIWIGLWGLSCIYRVLHFCRNQLYQFKILAQFQSEKTVISIGNITVGGTGKSPVVSSVLTFLEQYNVPLAVLTRGYGRKVKTRPVILNQESRPKQNILECGDEPWMLSLRHPETSFYISANRAKSARSGQDSADIFVMDDGMQHLRLKRELDICLVDAVCGFGNGQLLPLGPLREPLKNINRVDAIIITKTNLESETSIEDTLKVNLTKEIPIFKAQYKPVFIRGYGIEEKTSIDALIDKNCILISGIGNPRGFEKTIQSLRSNILRHFTFQDHYGFDENVLSEIEKEISHEKFDYIITTEKDFVKMRFLEKTIPKLCYLEMEMVIGDKFFNFLKGFLITRKIIQD
jgi:tetraacyldisaccharide 4'-kinase